MPIVPEGPAPYPPVGQVIAVIERHRASGLPEPVTTDKIARLIGSDGLAPRVMKALELLDLIDEKGKPTPQFDELAKASAQDFKERFAEVVRAGYADVFQYIDPATATPGQIEGQFRNYTPRGQLHRMVALFRGLCTYAGIIELDVEDTPAQRAAKRNQRQRVRRHEAGAATPKRTEIPDEPPRKYASAPGANAPMHPFILTLLEQLPDVGSEWSAADRKAWTSFAESGFNLLYRLPSDDRGGGSD